MTRRSSRPKHRVTTARSPKSEPLPSGVVVKSVITPACHAGGRGFESRPPRPKRCREVARAEADPALRDSSQEGGRPQTPWRPAPARAGNAGGSVGRRWRAADGTSENAPVAKPTSGWVDESRLQTGPERAAKAEKPRRVTARCEMQHSRVGNGLHGTTNPWGRDCTRSSDHGQGNAGRGSPGDEPGRGRGEGNTLEGGNPMSVSGTKQGRRGFRGSNPQGSEKGRRGMASGVEPGHCADSVVCERWRGREPHGRRPWSSRQLAARGDGGRRFGGSL